MMTRYSTCYAEDSEKGEPAPFLHFHITPHSLQWVSINTKYCPSTTYFRFSSSSFPHYLQLHKFAWKVHSVQISFRVSLRLGKLGVEWLASDLSLCWRPGCDTWGSNQCRTGYHGERRQGLPQTRARKPDGWLEIFNLFGVSCFPFIEGTLKTLHSFVCFVLVICSSRFSPSYYYDLHGYVNDIWSRSDVDSGRNEQHPDVGVLVRSKCKWLQMDTWLHTCFYLLSPVPSVNVAKQVSREPNKRLITLPGDCRSQYKPWLWSYNKSMVCACFFYFYLFIYFCKLGVVSRFEESKWNA